MPEANARRALPRAAETNDAESPLAWLRRRKDRDGVALISEAQFDAGERLRADFWLARMTPRVTVNWASAGPGQRSRRAGMSFRGATVQETVAAAQERVRRALTAVGPEFDGILIDVCCHLMGLELAEKTAGWPQRSGKVVLQLALSALARHYGIETGALPARRGGVQHWGADGYRPLFEVPAE
jgi:hypothetical protein